MCNLEVVFPSSDPKTIIDPCAISGRDVVERHAKAPKRTASGDVTLKSPLTTSRNQTDNRPLGFNTMTRSRNNDAHRSCRR